MINIGVLGSTNGTDLQAVIDAIEDKIVDASIKVVISNKKNAFILKRAKNHNLNAKYITHKNKTRNGFDQEVTDQLKENDVELILLIGFMRILSNEFCQNWQDKILNVHPSLLPKFKGLDTFNRVLKANEKFTGCTVHFVDEKLDNGKIIIKKRIYINKGLNKETLKNIVQIEEYKAYSQAIRKIYSAI